MTATIEETLTTPDEVLAPGITPEAVVHLRRAVQAMREHYDAVHMGIWWEKSYRSTSCGTVGCIAGWVIHTLPPEEAEEVLNMYRTVVCFYYELAATFVLGIGNLAEKLFHVEDWPQYYRDLLAFKEPRSYEYVEVIAERVEYFIREGK